jgi:hypothetical protein
MDWRCGSSGRAPALQVQNPEFKRQSHQQNKTKTKNKPTLITAIHHQNTFVLTSVQSS